MRESLRQIYKILQSIQTRTVTKEQVQQMKNDLAKILADNIKYIPQADGFVIHGAIENIIEYFERMYNDELKDLDEGEAVGEDEIRKALWEGGVQAGALQRTIKLLISKYNLTRKQ